MRVLAVLLMLSFAFSIYADAGAERANYPLIVKTRIGRASWYRGFFVAGNKFFVNGHYAAMWGVPLGTKVRVTDIDNGKAIIVAINDRGPNKRLVAKGRIIDLAAKAFYDLNGNFKASTIRVKLEILR
jgi:rare lipoprotein A